MKRNIAATLISITLLLWLGLIVGFDLYDQAPPEPEPNWAQSSENKLLIIDRFHGEVDVDYMPPLQIRGNGHALIVYYENSERHVLETVISEQELWHLVTDIIQANFFENDTRFDSTPRSGDYLFLSLNVEHSVALDENATVEILAEQLVSHIQEIGQPYSPNEGILNVYQVDYELSPNTIIHIWPDEEFGYSLAEIVHEDKFIDGDILQFVWKIRNSANQVVESNGKFYTLSVRAIL